MLMAFVADTRPGRTPAEDLLDLIHRRPAWHADAACREHPDLTWFPELGAPLAAIRAAKAVCAGCLSLEECRAWALAQGPELQGVWAGMSWRERGRLRRRVA